MGVARRPRRTRAGRKTRRVRRHVYRRPAAPARPRLAVAARREPRRDGGPAVAGPGAALAGSLRRRCRPRRSRRRNLARRSTTPASTAAVLNRINTLGPAPGRRSRGELPLAALDHPTAGGAAGSIARIDPARLSPVQHGHRRRRRGLLRALHRRQRTGRRRQASVDVEAVPAGLSMITAYDRNDLRSPRIRRYLPQVRGGTRAATRSGDWGGWIALLAARDFDPDAGPGGAMTVVTSTGFGTVSCVVCWRLPAERKERRGLAVRRPAAPARRRSGDDTRR